MSKVLLISIETLKKEYLVDDNLDDKYIISNIQKCQDFRLEPMVEDLRWNEIMTQVENGTVSTENNTLIKKYFQPIIAYFVMSEIVYSTAYKLKNAGLGGVDDKGNKGNQYRYKELIDISNKYLNDSSDILHLLTKSMVYWKIGDKGNADKGFRFIKSKCDRILEQNPNLVKEKYLGNIWMLGLTTFILDGKEKALIRMKEMTEKYPDDKFVTGTYEKIGNYSNANEIIEDYLP